ncbi:MAG: hypothetical protein RQ745_09740 [Longimicrobiales bacterium]|nr:hypothetical protein [Longimicrobiales bacterium]
MKAFLLYTVIACTVIAGATLGVGATLDPVGRRSLVWAAGIAIPVQLIAFGALLRTRDQGNAFLLAFAGGGAARLGVLGVAGLLVTRMESDLAAAPLMLGLAGYLFALLLLEGLFLRMGARTRTTE